MTEKQGFLIRPGASTVACAGAGVAIHIAPTLPGCWLAGRAAGTAGGLGGGILDEDDGTKGGGGGVKTAGGGGGVITAGAFGGVIMAGAFGSGIIDEDDCDLAPSTFFALALRAASRWC